MKFKKIIDTDIIIAVLIIVICGLLLSILNGSQAKNQAKNQKETIANLEAKVYHLENLNGCVLVMEQLLPPLVIMELRAYNEVIRQNKIEIATGGDQKEGAYGK